MRLLELFSGIGAQSKALKNLGIQHETTACEIDKRIHSVYESIHGSTPNLGDITKVASLPECDILTYSFPCQDLSILGNRKGLEKNSGTRSSLLWEVERLLRSTKKLPGFLVLENVKQLVSPKHIENFKLWLSTLESIGYKNSWKVVNSEEFGLPQKRERVFVVSSLDKEFVFPQGASKAKLGDFMEKDEDVRANYGDSLYFKCPKMEQRIWTTINNTQSTNSTNRVYGKNAVVHALTTQGSHPGNFGAVLYSSELDENFPLRERTKGLGVDDLKKKSLGFDINSIRLMSPKESMLLMGFSESDYLKAKNHMKEKKIKETFFYHVAGNSIAVPVLESIFKNLV
ncbi:DNA (cytosine-5-)-methyltransferase [bacterium]|nr:DNA (cytosine-5-)-methyltransferase [bacterium]